MGQNPAHLRNQPSRPLFPFSSTASSQPIPSPAFSPPSQPRKPTPPLPPMPGAPDPANPCRSAHRATSSEACWLVDLCLCHRVKRLHPISIWNHSDTSFIPFPKSSQNLQFKDQSGRIWIEESLRCTPVAFPYKNYPDTPPPLEHKNSSLSSLRSTTVAKLDGCHIPFRESGNEASIRMPRMFKSHVQ
jgi:hypothetical protein